MTEVTGKLTPEEQKALGKAARKRVPRESHASFDPPAGRPDPVTLLEDQAKTRLPDLVPVRYGRMLASQFAYYRGAALPMATDLAHTPTTGLTVQACGDAHLSNFGVFGSPERRLLFDVNDFDETLPGPWEWDVKRLAASLEIAARQNGFGRKQRRTIVTSAVRQLPAGDARVRRHDQHGRLVRERGHRRARSAFPFPGQRRQGASSWIKQLARARTSDSMRALNKLTDRVTGSRGSSPIRR